MKLWTLATTATVLIISASANASLIGRDLDGNLTTAEAYYDDQTNLTWLADTNYAMTSGYDSDGRMNWVDANNWAIELDINGYSNWRLPSTENGCTGSTCYQSELGSIYFRHLMIDDSYWPVILNHDSFINLQSAAYWSSSYYNPGGLEGGIYFDMYNAIQFYEYNEASLHYAWALSDGDIGMAVSAVPIPAAIWLFGSGLVGLIGLARRKKV